MALRNIYVSFDEDSAKSLMSGELDVEYTGEVFYNMSRSEDGSVPGYDFSYNEGDVFYGCACEFKEIKSFKKINK